MQCGRRQRQKKDPEHLRIDRLLHLLVIHADFLQNCEALFVLIALRHLLKVENQHRYGEEQDREKRTEEQQPAVEPVSFLHRRIEIGYDQLWRTVKGLGVLIPHGVDEREAVLSCSHYVKAEAFVIEDQRRNIDKFALFPNEVVAADLFPFGKRGDEL